MNFVVRYLKIAGCVNKHILMQLLSIAQNYVANLRSANLLCAWMHAMLCVFQVKIIKVDFGLTIDIEDLINKIDADGSGEIEFEEFKTLLS
jgi:EF hand